MRSSPKKIADGHPVTRQLGEQQRSSLTHLVVLPDRWVVRHFNDTGHLRTDLDRPVQPLT